MYEFGSLLVFIVTKVLIMTLLVFVLSGCFDSTGYIDIS